jgi:hypothetical protein
MIKTVELFIIVLLCMSEKSKSFVLDTFTVSPNIYERTAVPCINIIYEGELTLTQNFEDYIRKTTLQIADTENTEAYGHSLCISNGIFSKSSGPIGISYFEMEYLYSPMIIINPSVTPLLLRIRIDLPQNITLYFSLETDTGAAIHDYFVLGDFMVENQFYTLAIFTNITVNTVVKSIKFNILPPENNIDMRLSYPLNPMRTNYFQYRHVVTSPYSQRGMLAVDGDISTSWRVFENTSANLTVYFPLKLLNKSITINWLAPPTSVNLGYLSNTVPQGFISIQKWNNNKPINKTNKKLMPALQIDNIHLIVEGFAVLTDITYPLPAYRS